MGVTLRACFSVLASTNIAYRYDSALLSKTVMSSDTLRELQYSSRSSPERSMSTSSGGPNEIEVGKLMEFIFTIA
jgi:hypothetical protein